MITTFGKALRRCRRAAGVTQRAVAAKAGVDFSYISKLENDRIPPPAADTIIRISRALSVSPDSLLAMTGKVPTAVRQMLGSNPLALRFFRDAADLALTDQEWGQLTRTLSQLRDGAGQPADRESPRLPEILSDLFWDYNLDDLSWPADRELVISRILTAGDWRAVTWLRERLEARELSDWLTKRRGRGLDARRLRFWELILGLPHQEVEDWLRAVRQEAWGRRTGP